MLPTTRNGIGTYKYIYIAEVYTYYNETSYVQYLYFVE